MNLYLKLMVGLHANADAVIQLTSKISASSYYRFLFLFKVVPIEGNSRTVYI